jgi:hypothetical protein
MRSGTPCSMGGGSSNKVLARRLRADIEHRCEAGAHGRPRGGRTGPWAQCRTSASGSRSPLSCCPRGRSATGATTCRATSASPEAGSGWMSGGCRRRRVGSGQGSRARREGVDCRGRCARGKSVVHPARSSEPNVMWSAVGKVADNAGRPNWRNADAAISGLPIALGRQQGVRSLPQA